MDEQIKINRAPVLTLWATIVAERLGYSRPEALTLGRAVAGMNAQSKGQRLGIYEPSQETTEKAQEAFREAPLHVTLMGRRVPAEKTEEGVRALDNGKPVSPQSVERYLQTKFKNNLDDVQAAMQALAQSYPPEELARKAYDLYEKFRPTVPEGTRGWGAMGILDLQTLRRLEK